jgi:PhnB protein
LAHIKGEKKMHTISYLFFNGDCAKAIAFYKTTMGAKAGGIMLNKDLPNPASRMPGGDDLVVNAMLDIGKTTIMASDVPAGRYEKPQGFRICVEVDSAPEADRIFAALSDGGDVAMAIDKTFWADRFGMVTDKYNTPWMVSFIGSGRRA